MGRSQSKLGSSWIHRSQRDHDNSGQVLFRTESGALDCVSSVCCAANDLLEQGDSLESVHSLTAECDNVTRTANKHKYVRIATSPLEDARESSETPVPTLQSNDVASANNVTDTGSEKLSKDWTQIANENQGIDDTCTCPTLGNTGHVLQPKSSLKRKSSEERLGYHYEKSATDSKQISEILQQKLTPEDLNALLQFVCSAVRKSLEEHLHVQTPNDPNLHKTAAPKHVRISSINQVEEYEICETKDPSQPTRRRKHGQRHRSRSLCFLNESNHLALCSDYSGFTDLHQDPSQFQDNHSIINGLDSNNDASTGPFLNDCKLCISHHAKRCKKGKKQLKYNKNSPVDVSLDDDCPGIPENKHRARHHTHRSLCDRCIPDTSIQSQMNYLAPCEMVMPDGPTQDTKLIQGHNSHGTKERYLTLMELKVAAELKIAALTLEQNSESQTGWMLGKRRSTKSKLKGLPQITASSVPEFSEADFDPYFLSKPRTGQESPTTDMSVVSLNIASSIMVTPSTNHCGAQLQEPSGHYQHHTIIHS